MANLTKLTMENVFRDTNTWYVERGKSRASQELIRFCQQYAGDRILDLGCATGEYCLALDKIGFKCTGVDINKSYVKIARERGVNAYHATGRLPFNDRSFDTVVMFEVLEHISNPEQLLQEAKRVAEKNILITVPDCGGFDDLGRHGLTYNHFLDTDHVNFFTKEELENFLAIHFDRFKVEKKEPILGAIGLPWWLRKSVSLLYRIKILKPRIFYRLYAVIELKVG